MKKTAKILGILVFNVCFLIVTNGFAGITEQISGAKVFCHQGYLQGLSGNVAAKLKTINYAHLTNYVQLIKNNIPKYECFLTFSKDNQENLLKNNQEEDTDQGEVTCYSNAERTTKPAHYDYSYTSLDKNKPYCYVTKAGKAASVIKTIGTKSPDNLATSSPNTINNSLGSDKYQDDWGNWTEDEMCKSLGGCQ